MNRPVDVRKHEGKTDTEHLGMIIMLIKEIFLRVAKGMLLFITRLAVRLVGLLGAFLLAVMVQCCLGALFLGGILPWAMPTLKSAAILHCSGALLQPV